MTKMREDETLYDIALEDLSAQLHEVYQKEAKRQGDVRHPDKYSELREATKEYDRALARFILGREKTILDKLQKGKEALEDIAELSSDFYDDESEDILELINQKANESLEGL